MGSFSPFPARPAREAGFARGGGRFTGGSWIHPAFLRKVVEAAPEDRTFTS
jgi:hypothetical protein